MMDGKTARAHAESAKRQLGPRGAHIDPDKIEREAQEAFERHVASRDAAATKEDMAELNRKLDRIERMLNQPRPIFTNAIAGEQGYRGVRGR